MTVEEGILQMLMDKQRSMELGNQEFAAELGISPWLWYKTILPPTNPSRKPIGPMIAVAARDRWPEDADLVWAVNRFLVDVYPRRRRHKVGGG